MTSLAAKRNVYVYSGHGLCCRGFMPAAGAGKLAKILACCVFLCAFAANVRAQTLIKLYATGHGDSLVQQASAASPAEARRWLGQWLGSKQALGYAAASIDSSVAHADTLLEAWVYLGIRYQWAEVRMQDSLQALARQSGLSTAAFGSGRAFYPNFLEPWYQKMLTYLGTQGRPFASIGFSQLAIDSNGRVSGEMYLHTGQGYQWDSVFINGRLKLNERFLGRYLGIYKGQPYDERQVAEAAHLMDALPYARLTQPPRLALLSSGARLELFADNRKSNEVNVLVGLLPASPQTGGKLLLTGEALLNLRNSFGSGEAINLQWTQLLPQSPRLRLGYQQPFLFGSRYGADLRFELFKKDSTFLTLQFRVGGTVAISRRQNVSLYLQQFSSSLLTVDTLAVKNSLALPPEADVRNTLLGIGYLYNTTGLALIPRKGWEINFQLAAGRRRILTNNTIAAITHNGFSLARLYDTVLLNTYQLRTQAVLARYMPLGKQSVVKAALNLGWVQSGSYYRNELFQIGGYRLLRGFDDESIFTRQYNVLSAEYRLLIGESSYFFGFADAALAQVSVGNAFSYQQYLGSGLGLALNTGKGIFNFAYALGASSDAGFSLRQGKIHIGFVSLL